MGNVGMKWVGDSEGDEGVVWVGELMGGLLLWCICCLGAWDVATGY